MEEADIENVISDILKNRSINEQNAPIINLGIGCPDSDLLINCCDIFEKATCHLMKTEGLGQAEVFRYGPGPGSLKLRVQIAEYLTEAYKNKVISDNLFITSGATQGLHLILSTLVDLNGYVFVDEITFMLAIGVIKDFNTLTIIKVKLNDDGVDVDDLRNNLTKTHFTSKAKRFWGVYYTMPVFHNPTGITFTDRVCRQLVKVAREFDVLVLCDDVYNILCNDEAEVPKRLFQYDNPEDIDFKGNVISNSSFSKTVSPGIRLGWIEASRKCTEILSKSGIIQSSGCLNYYTSGIMASLFELGLVQDHIKFTKAVCTDRILAATEVFKNNLPKSCTVTNPKGGYFLWIRMPEHADSRELLKICLIKHNVFFLCGYSFSVDDNDLRNYFRISIVAERKVLITACRGICKSLHEYLKSIE